MAHGPALAKSTLLKYVEMMLQATRVVLILFHQRCIGAIQSIWIRVIGHLEN